MTPEDRVAKLIERLRDAGFNVRQARNHRAFTHLPKCVVIDLKDRDEVMQRLRFTPDCPGTLIYAAVRRSGIKCRWKGDEVMLMSVGGR